MDTKKLKADIKLARAWARKHFAASPHPDLLTDPLVQFASTELEFPAPDEMQAWPCIFGERVGICVFYRLSWPDDGSLLWIPHSPFSGARMRNPQTGKGGKLIVRTGNKEARDDT